MSASYTVTPDEASGSLICFGLSWPTLTLLYPGAEEKAEREQLGLWAMVSQKPHIFRMGECYHRSFLVKGLSWNR